MGNKGILENSVVRNLLGAVCFVLGLVIVVSVFLKIYTRHNKEIVVPDLSNLTYEEAASVAGAAELNVVVGDSVYVNRMRKGAVFSQNPKAGSRVKKDRKITLTLNAVNAKKVTMPLLVGYSMRQAKAELLSKGLRVGKLIYVNDMATNNVLKQQYKGKPIEPGTMIDSGSQIDLVVGLNSQDGRTFVPDLTGSRYLRAVDAVLDNSLNIGRLRFDETVKSYNDTLNAFVYAQTPGSNGGPVRMGEQVSLSLTLDESKIPVSGN